MESSWSVDGGVWRAERVGRDILAFGQDVPMCKGLFTPGGSLRASMIEIVAVYQTKDALRRRMRMRFRKKPMVATKTSHCYNERWMSCLKID
jgi:hypothetical protein